MLVGVGGCLANCAIVFPEVSQLIQLVRQSGLPVCLIMIKLPLLSHEIFKGSSRRLSKEPSEQTKGPNAPKSEIDWHYNKILYLLICFIRVLIC